jgi:hypothetical protein
MNKYRKLWESHFGPIPKDSTGRSYEIHHIDGNRENNNISNLKLLTIQEHYDIHFAQGDYGACQAIILRMDHTFDSDKLSAHCSILAKLRVAAGTHNLVGKKNPIHSRVADGTHSMWLSNRNKKLVSGNKHNLQKRADGTSQSSDRVASGRHNFTPEKSREAWIKSSEIQQAMIGNGTHHSCVITKCPWCGKEGKGNSMRRWHFNKCKRKQ